MYHRTIIVASVIVSIVLLLLFYNGCGGNRIDGRYVDRYVDRIKTDTVRTSDTVIIKRRYKDTVVISMVDSIPVVYWDTVYKDSVSWYVVNYSDSSINIDNEILAGGKLYETKFSYNICVPERVITNNITVTNTETVMAYRRGLYLGFGGGYPLSIGAAIGWQFKDGSFLLGQKDFLNKETFNVCLVTPVFRR